MRLKVVTILGVANGGAMMNKINVLLVEDDPVWREYIAESLQLEPDLYMVGTAETKDDAVRTVRLLDIDVVLMDVMLGDKTPDGIEAALEIGAMQKSKVIMLTVLEQEEIMIEAFAYRVCNYLVKTKMEDIPGAIRAAYNNQSVIQSPAAEALRKEFVRMKRMEWRQQLTNAESGVLRLIDEGQTQSQISETLHIAESTVKTHINRILRKFKVRTGKEAARQAKMKGIL